MTPEAIQAALDFIHQSTLTYGPTYRITYIFLLIYTGLVFMPVFYHKYDPIIRARGYYLHVLQYFGLLMTLTINYQYAFGFFGCLAVTIVQHIALTMQMASVVLKAMRFHYQCLYFDMLASGVKSPLIRKYADFLDRTSGGCGVVVSFCYVDNVDDFRKGGDVSCLVLLGDSVGACDWIFLYNSIVARGYEGAW